MKIPLACAEYLPSPSQARLKMHDHITEVHSPQSTRNKAATGTVTMLNEKLAKTGIDTDDDLPRNIARRMNTMPSDVAKSIIWRLDTLLAMKADTVRPTSISSQ